MARRLVYVAASGMALVSPPEVSVSRCGISRDGRFVSDSWLRGVVWSAELKEVLRDEHSPYQRITVVDTVSLGRALVLDGALQCAERDEKGYHEMMAHVPLLRAGARSNDLRVLIVGGGDGGAARECLRHPHVGSVTLVDIDEQVVKAARELLPSLWPPTLDQDPRLEVVHHDGCEYVTSSARDDLFDVILVDASDPVGPGVALYQPKFYEALRRRLRPDGAVVAQAGSYWYLPRVFRTVYHGLKSAGFDIVKPYSCFSAVYPGGQWNLMCATTNSRDDPALPLLLQKSDSSLHTEFYDAENHVASFVLPPLAKGELAKPPPDLSETAADLAEIYS